MKKLEECKIIVVDDTETNIDLLLDALGDIYRVGVAMDGQTALDDITKDKPDLILLDIMMPEMNGYEVCERLKEDAATQDIPVIFLTAMTKDIDEAKGLALGAVDYVNKPFNPDLLKARVRNQLLLKLQRDELAKQNEILVENAKLKEDIQRITQHDLKNPLNGIINFPTLVLSTGVTNDEQKNYLKKISSLGKKMLRMINLSLDMYKMEQGTYNVSPQSVKIEPIIRSIFDENQTVIDLDELSVEIHSDLLSGEADDFTIQGEELLCYSMLANIIKNAIEASDVEQAITITLNDNSRKSIRIHNEAVVPEDIREVFFDKYATSSKSGGTGLGTYSARLIAKTFGGDVKLETSVENGTSVTFEFPE